MHKSRIIIYLVSGALTCILSGCALTKIITVPVKATCTVVGGTADVID